MTPQIVKLEKPTHIDEMVRGLQRVIKRLKEGEFESVLVMGFAPDGRWFTKELGRRHSRLEMVGILECIKTDLIDNTNTDEPSGLDSDGSC